MEGTDFQRVLNLKYKLVFELAGFSALVRCSSSSLTLQKPTVEAVINGGRDEYSEIKHWN